MSECKFRGERVTLDDGREVVVPKIPVGVQRDNIGKIKAAAEAAQKVAASPNDLSAFDLVVEANTRYAEVVLLALNLNHPEITLADLMATCSSDNIGELYAAVWKRRGGSGKGEAESP